ncbi:MAG TPA: hypothetical protein VIL85_19670 [Thermomicrobiales bacterium]|jgi:hypothetical protein
MSETLPRYRTLDRPGPGLATIREPDGLVALWSLTRVATHSRRCAQCGAIAGLSYRPSIQRGKDTPRLCRPCVEGAPAHSA